MYELLIPLIAGILGGIVRFILGWSKNGEDFESGKALKSIARAIIGGMIFGYAFILPSGIGIIESALMVFFAAITTDTLIHDFYKSVITE